MSEIRRKLIVGGTRVLPSDYQQVEYLESTGTQYIAPDMYPSNELGEEITIKFAFTRLVYESYIMGKGSQNGYTYGVIKWWTGDYINIHNVGQENPWQGASLQLKYDTDIHIAVLGNPIMSIDGRETKYNGTPWNVGTIYIFKGYQNYNNAYARVYKIDRAINGELTHLYIPCYRKSDNKPGMYNLISGVFFTNVGTGEFIIGPEI